MSSNTTMSLQEEEEEEDNLFEGCGPLTAECVNDLPFISGYAWCEAMLLRQVASLDWIPWELARRRILRLTILGPHPFCDDLAGHCDPWIEAWVAYYCQR